MLGTSRRILFAHRMAYVILAHAMPTDVAVAPMGQGAVWRIPTASMATCCAIYPKGHVVAKFRIRAAGIIAPTTCSVTPP